MFQKTVKKFCTQPGCRLQGVPVDLALNVCEEDGALLSEEKVLDRRAVAIVSAIAVVIIGVGSFAGTLIVRRWLVTKATTAVMSGLQDVYDSGYAQKLTERVAAMIGTQGRDSGTLARIDQQLRNEAASHLNDPAVTNALESVYRDGVKTSAEDAELKRLLTGLTANYGVSPAAFAAREKQVKTDYERIQGQMQKAITLAANGDFDQAAQGWRKVVETDPQNSWARANLCAAYMQMNRIDLARDECARAVKVEPGNWLAHYNLASIRVADGDSASALGELQAALKLVEDDAPVQMTREKLLVQMKQDSGLKKLRQDPRFAKLVGTH